MRSLIIVLAIALVPALAACDKRVEQTQADIKKGNPEGGQMKKKYEAAAKEAEERRGEAK